MERSDPTGDQDDLADGLLGNFEADVNAFEDALGAVHIAHPNATIAQKANYLAIGYAKSFRRRLKARHPSTGDPA